MSWRSLLPNDAGIALQFQCAAGSPSAPTMNSSGDRIAFVVQVTKAGNIHKVKFRTGTVTTGDTVRVSLQNLDASGDPDGTADQSVNQAIANTDDNVYFNVTLGSDRTVAAGDIFAVVFDYPSYVAGNLAINVGLLGALEGMPGHSAPIYLDFYDGAAWTKTTTRVPLIILEYDDGTVAYQPGCVPFWTNTGIAFSSSSTPDENGNIIKFDETTRVVGFELFVDADAAYDVVLYDTNGTSVLASKTVDVTARGSNATHKTVDFFSSGATCIGGSSYRLVVKPTTTTNITILQSANDANATTDLNVLLGGADWHKTSRTDAGAWTENTLRRVAIWPVIDAIDVPSGGGGMLVHPGMTGGMRG